MRGSENEFQLFLYLSQRIHARSAVKVSARSALTEGSDSLTFVLIRPRVELGHTSRARSAQAGESFRVVDRNELLRDCCCRSAQGRRNSTL
jgi:hypothetical protein